MKPYIFTERNGIHIIDLQQTLEALEESYALIRDIVADGGTVLFVGTKRQAQETIELEAKRCSMPYVNLRWLGGTLTNWQTIRSRIDELENLERRRAEGEFDLLTKKEALSMDRKIDKLESRLGGIREMRSLPEALFVVDVLQEETAIHEANLLKIPVVALVDTNCDPNVIDYVIPSNDDAIRAIKLLASTIADAVLEGKAMRKDEEKVSEPESDAIAAEQLELSDEDLLGEATLAKLQSGEFGDKEKEAEKESEQDEEEASEAEAEPSEEEESEEDNAEIEPAEDEESEEDEAETEPSEEDDDEDDDDEEEA
jgi:small subunit ribosomal protein S2